MTNFRVWAPASANVHLVIRAEDREQIIECQPEANGYFSCATPVAPGARYAFRLSDSPDLLPDPASRYQPDGPFGLSQVISTDYTWSDSAWPGVDLPHQVFYELHLGTFTQEGTWNAAARELPELARLGITVIELMPIADFSGQYGWGYDGVNLFAPSRLYGTPDDARRFVEIAHANGIAVILDVVYNHLGPTGNFLARFAPQYFHSTKSTDWGDAINFDGEDSGPVREFYLTNAAYWIREFHFDGLRLDATQDIHDSSEPNILRAIGETVRIAADGRRTIVIAENEPQHARLVRPPSRNGYGLDGLWNDDFHHSATVALTGRNEAYYTDYRGKAYEFVSALKYGYLFQGQHYSWQKQCRGTPALDLELHTFLIYLQNHDQVANSAHGVRLHQLTSPGRWRAMTAVLLLGPNTPLLFQGQEFNAREPFLYFADHGDELAPIIANGRVEFLSQFRSIATENAVHALSDPGSSTTFESCKLDLNQRNTHAAAYALHCDLLQIRKTDLMVSNAKRNTFDAAALNEQVFLIRYFSESGGDRLLIVNLGADWEPNSIPNPLLAPPQDCIWTVSLSTEDVRYGGGGAFNPCNEGKWRIPGEAAVLLKAAAKGPS